jgi:sigma-E factor negative regulatory protein RseA
MVMENVSALMDGELEDQPAQRELTRLKEDGGLRERWETFHLIGDAMRGDRILSPAFDEMIAKRLAAEPTVLSPRRRASPAKRYTTYALSAAASVSAAALVAWVAIAPNAPSGLQANLGGSPATGTAVNAQVAPAIQSVSSDGRMNEYMLAHQGFSPSNVFQGLVPYIRTVSATRPAEGR